MSADFLIVGGRIGASVLAELLGPRAAVVHSRKEHFNGWRRHSASAVAVLTPATNAEGKGF